MHLQRFAAPAAPAALNFLAGSVVQYDDCDGPQTYALGKNLTFQSTTGDIGLAEGVFVRFKLAVTPTIATGHSAIWSLLHSFATQVTISQGGEQFKQVHPAFFEQREFVMRRLYRQNYALSAGSRFYPSGHIGGTLPALATGVTANIVYTFFIPFRWIRNPAVNIGMFPVGDSANALKIVLQTPAEFAGLDPENNAILMVAGDSATVTGTVDCTIAYRSVLSYKPGQSVTPPVVGTQVKVAQQAQAINSVGSEIVLQHGNLFPHPLIITLTEDGNANPDAATEVNGTGLSSLFLSRFRFSLTKQTPVFDLSEEQTIAAYWAANRYAYGDDLIDGVWPYAPILETGAVGAGYWTDPTDEWLQQIPNFADWKNALTGVTVASGQTINSAGAGLARITEFAEYLVGVNY